MVLAKQIIFMYEKLAAGCRLFNANSKMRKCFIINILWAGEIHFVTYQRYVQDVLCILASICLGLLKWVVMGVFRIFWISGFHSDIFHWPPVMRKCRIPKMFTFDSCILTIVYSTVHSCADQRKYQSSSSLAFVWGTRRWPANSPHKWPVTRKMFPFDDVIMKINKLGWTAYSASNYGTVNLSYNSMHGLVSHLIWC